MKRIPSAENLYVHFPFCRRKCAYCALESRAGSTTDERAAYVAALAERLTREVPSGHTFRTVYFGGGTPALAYLDPLLAALAPHLRIGRAALCRGRHGGRPSQNVVGGFGRAALCRGRGSAFGCPRNSFAGSRRIRHGGRPSQNVVGGFGRAALCRGCGRHGGRPSQGFANNSEETEFTVELHPLDVSADLLKHLKDGGVNRISLGVQSLDDEVLADMGRGYTFAEAERAFASVRDVFENAGIDLIVGYPGEETALSPRHARLEKWGLAHCSAYSLILEEKTVLANRVRAKETLLPDDETTMNRLGLVRDFLEAIGLRRYEISNYAKPGFECRHNCAVWKGEDYLGIGRGACGRLGLRRTKSLWTDAETAETLSAEEDAKERLVFSLRTRDGLDVGSRPDWRDALDRAAGNGLLTRAGTVYRLTRRGAEVCDAILEELV